MSQRKNFISAVKCLQTSPSLLPPGQVPGSFSLYDDFVYVHLSQTPTIHLTVWPRRASSAPIATCGGVQ